ncbi:GNAT family N-acetyltransferase [Methylobacterium pseudosasicola]|uniref:Acetyltransferase (GNAT) domain-containing protein n=1 Tax=Methylobacterium pseudosasicola TaxID=582667 RepID=A0A1I4L077_9HYPH|nr:GNAT family N-acetyltransferase [Methylobacterium pseudosasicola]SFL84420.1 Acetyltransferase (GNAT) domain-containing protein [Methylobacterium pseudosasicola]
MTEAPFAVLRLGAADAADFREIRLHGLRRHPEAFGASYEDETSLSLEESARRLDSGIVFGVRRAGRSGLDGVAGLHIPQAIKTRHKGMLWGMYVRSEARGMGFGSVLLARVIAHAAAVVEELTLSVGASNEQAMGLYTRAGFERYGLEERALKIEGRYYDEVWMRLVLAG